MANRGRPRSFDRDHALQRLMAVFWAKGYEGAQVNDLIAAIGVTPPSFYAAFDSKEAAFREAVDLYVVTAGAGALRGLDEGSTADESIRAMLSGSIETALGAPRPGGCLLILGIVNCQLETEPLRDLLKSIRKGTEARIRARLERAVNEGDLPAASNVRVLANYYSTVMQGLSMQARDGATREELEALVAPAMAALR